MGFMDKVKGAMNAVTGNAAKITIEYTQVGYAGGQVQVRVTATSTGAEVKSKGIYVDLRAMERVKVSKKASPMIDNDLTVEAKLYNESILIAPAFVLGAGATQVFEGAVTLPPTAQPTFTGNFTQHAWEIRGRLDAKGNDPDSKFQPIRVGLQA